MEKITKILRLQVLLGLLIVACLICFHSEGYAQEVKKVGTSSAAFLKIPVGARGSSMGSAFVSLADDPSALFWNPGGLSRNQKYAFMVDHSPWLPGLNFNFFGLVVPMRNYGTLGISVTVLGTEEMLVTTPANPMGTGEKFDAASMAVGFSYGRSLTDRFSIGATFKYVNERIFNSTATAIAFDIGTIYDTPMPGLRLGVCVSNFGTKMQMDGEDLNIRVDVAPDQLGNNQSVVGRLKTEQFDLPLIMRLGLSFDTWQTETSRLTIAVDGINPSDNAQSVNVGAEISFLNELLILRGGYNELFLEDREKGFAAGVGFNLKMQGNLGVSASYGHQEFIHLGGMNRFTLVLTF
ncbi:PorV/PorQ family protein [candidate division KSB1 bacterium]|nr:PorV/PorQ family protein [candidate division KSB1 bacterium]